MGQSCSKKPNLIAAIRKMIFLVRMLSSQKLSSSRVALISFVRLTLIHYHPRDIKLDKVWRSIKKINTQ